jgi:hypothetical protein
VNGPAGIKLYTLYVTADAPLAPDTLTLVRVYELVISAFNEVSSIAVIVFPRLYKPEGTATTTLFVPTGIVILKTVPAP